MVSLPFCDCCLSNDFSSTLVYNITEEYSPIFNHTAYRLGVAGVMIILMAVPFGGAI